MAQMVKPQTAFASEPDEHGRFGIFGGQYAPETVMPALTEIAMVVAAPFRSVTVTTSLAPPVGPAT